MCQVEHFLSGACVHKTMSLVQNVTEKIKCVWQRNVHSLRFMCGDSLDKQLDEVKAELFLQMCCLCLEMLKGYAIHRTRFGKLCYRKHRNALLWLHKICCLGRDMLLGGRQACNHPTQCAWCRIMTALPCCSVIY